MLRFEKNGRNLVLHVEGVQEPYSIPPLPTNAGLQITATYLGIAGGGGTTADLTDMMMMAVDGAVLDDDTGVYRPHSEEQRPNYTRAGAELSQEEAENVLSAAFFWQTALGVAGVRTFIDGGEGTIGSVKALAALTGRIRALGSRPTTQEAAHG